MAPVSPCRFLGEFLRAAASGSLVTLGLLLLSGLSLRQQEAEGTGWCWDARSENGEETLKSNDMELREIV